MKTRPWSLHLAGVLVAASVLWSPVAARQPASDSAAAADRLRAFDQYKALRAASPFRKLAWTFVGPVAATGRLTDVAAHPDRPGLIFVTAASGGAFKTTDTGKTWTPIFEDQATACMGDITLAPSNPDIVWIGTGEANILRSSMAGTGVYKSIDGGATFRHMGLTDTQHIARIVIHPANPDIVYVASAGREYTFGPERGVYKTTDGGRTWTKVFYQDDKTGVIDLVMDPSAPETLYAGTADRRRYRWNDPMPTFRSGIHRTTDGGKTWKRLTNGLPNFASNEYERIGLDVCAAHPETVYAVVNRAAGDTKTKKLGAYLYRSDDGGETWRETEGNDKINGVFSDYGWYFGQVRADPVDPETVYVMGLGLRRSKDGGKTWENLKGNHTDYHGAWIDPKNPSHIMAVNDGGLTISTDGFASFEHPNNLPIAQLYNVSLTQTKGTFRMFSSRQDMGGYMGEATVGPTREITWKDWESGPGDESGRHAVDPANPNLVYFVNRYGSGPFLADFAQDNPRTKKPPLSKEIRPKGGEPRAQWVSPIIVSPHDPSRILYGCQYVYLTDDQGKTWRQISPDLTDFDPSMQGNINFSTVFAIAESPLKKGVIYAGTDDGLVHVTMDEGTTWTNITAGLPTGRFISSIEASRFDPGTVYVTVNGKRNDEFKTLVFKSADYGRRWTNLTAAFPGNNANVIKEDPTDKRILYLGTDQGVAVSVNGGRTWNVLGTGLPTVYVHDIAIQAQEHVAVIATHGRGAYALDLLPVRRTAKK